MSVSDRMRVVVTGIGLVTPFAADRERSWEGLRQGGRATRFLTAADGVSHFRSVDSSERTADWIGAPAPPLPESDRNGSDDRVVLLAQQAAQEAIRDARLDFESEERERAGLVIGTSKGGFRSFARLARGERTGRIEADEGARLWEQFLPNAPAVGVARRYRLGGPLLCPVAACATGLISLIRGVQLIQDGHCDLVLAGSTDASLQDVLLGSFRRLGVLARSQADPSTVCRPFDRNRSGFVVGEGAAVLILERLDRARLRNARPYAEWLGGGIAADPRGLTQLDTHASGLSHLISDVLQRAQVARDEVDYINAHGTATRQNDRCETEALKRVFGSRAYQIPCSSLKGGIGHLLGAAGSVETAAALLALRDQCIPPTVNLVDPDPDCDLDYTPQAARRAPLETVLKLSLGFGGHLAAALFRKFSD